MLFAFSGWLYVGALQTLLPHMITPLRARVRYRRELERKRVKSSTHPGETAQLASKDVLTPRGCQRPRVLDRFVL
jgi:hypothetical protein